MTIEVIKHEKLAPLLKRPEVKLDVGCGLHFMQPLDEWVHVDWCDHPEVEIVCDFGSIPLERGMASVIYLGDVIEHVKVYEQDRVLRHWNRLLTMGGVLAGATPNGVYDVLHFAHGGLTFEQLVQPRLYGWQDRPGEIHYTIFSRNTLTALLEKYGFAEVRFDDERHPKGKSPSGPTERGFDPRDESGAYEPWWLQFTARKVREV